jgi:cardiolipin synthase
VPFLSQFRALPNLLTLMRLFIIPFLLIEILDGDYGVDGLLARWLSQKTTLGQYLDPIADKLLLSSLFVVLTHVGLIPRYVTVLVFSRDVGILLISTLLFVTGSLRDFRPSFFGKLNTFVQILALIAVLLCQKLFISPAVTTLRDVLVRAIAVLAPLSAAQYAWIVLRRMSAPPETAI